MATHGPLAVSARATKSRAAAAPADLFAVSVIADAKSIRVSSITTWEDYADKEAKIELRKPSTHNSGRWWTLLREDHRIVSAPDELASFLRGGGHALIRQAVIAKWWPDFLKASPCVKHSLHGPFVALERLPPQARARFPRGVLRQSVFSRDGDRCRVCGRSPDDSLDVRLDLHHIVDWGRGGLTVEENLIALCATCHDGIDPADGERQEDLSDKVAIASARQHRWRHEIGVHHYRNHIRRIARAGSDAEQMPAAVLPLEWNDPTDFKLIFSQIAANSLMRSYTPRAWRAIVRPVIAGGRGSR